MELKSSTLLNPFVVGGAISEATGRGFFGREDIFHFVRSALQVDRRSPIVLVGHRRIGKSSILRQLPLHLPNDLVCVYFDLQGKATSELDLVLYGLSRAIADALNLPYPEREKATEETFARIFLPQVLNLLGDPRRLVLLLDEFDVIDESLTGRPIAAKRFIPYLGELVSRQPQIGLILVVGRRTDELSPSFSSALLKDSVEKRIGRLPREDVVELVKQLANATLPFSEAAIDRVFELATGHPFCTQVLCQTVWRRYFGQRRVQRVSRNDIDRVVPEAIALGTNGMNWIYDGLELPEQRLFLSALSEVADPLSGEAASYDDIYELLRERSISLGIVEMTRAMRDLTAWDVVESTPDGRFRFAVPILGAWVRQQRPVAQLEHEARFANPRAWNFYELAIESQQRGDLDAAVDNYLAALKINSVFLDAQRGLASAYRLRDAEGDLERAIEGWERTFTQDPMNSRTELLDTLMLGLERATTQAAVKARFSRIAELDGKAGSMVYDRAVRNLSERALEKMVMGSRSAVTRAAELFDLLGDDTEKQRAEDIAKRQNALTGWAVGGFLASPVLSWAVGYAPAADRLAPVQIILAGLSGLFLSWTASMERDARFTWRHAGLPALAVSAVVGTMVWYFFESLGGAVAAAWMIAFIVNIAANPVAPEDRDVMPGPSKSTGNLLVRVLDEVIIALDAIRARLNGRK